MDDYERESKKEFRRESVKKISNALKEGVKKGYDTLKDTRIVDKYSSIKVGKSGGSMSGSFTSGARRVSKVKGLKY